MIDFTLNHKGLYIIAVLALRHTLSKCINSSSVHYDTNTNLAHFQDAVIILKRHSLINNAKK